MDDQNSHPQFFTVNTKVGANANDGGEFDSENGNLALSSNEQEQITTELMLSNDAELLAQNLKQINMTTTNEAIMEQSIDSPKDQDLESPKAIQPNKGPNFNRQSFGENLSKSKEQ